MKLILLMYSICELKLFLDTKYSQTNKQASNMSSINLSGVDVDMTESLVDQELGEGAWSTTGVTDEFGNAQLEVKNVEFFEVERLLDLTKYSWFNIHSKL